MQFLIAFVEGIITFISPCLLPMLPVYISYFAGGSHSTRRALKNSLFFVLGFGIVFCLMGALAGTLGWFFNQYQTIVNIVLGSIVVFFGLCYLNIIKLNIFRPRNTELKEGELGVLSSMLFGMVFSIGWTPCVGTFLGSALMLASQQGSAVTGIIMLACYSLGLGLPFILSAVLLDKLKGAFNVIKRNYKVINTVCGILLIVIGVLMATGLMSRLIGLLV